MEKPSKSKEFSKSDVAILVVLNFAFVATTSPCFWGKADLELLLHQNGAYAELCSIEGEVCEERRLALSRAFTWSIASLKLSGVILGPLLDLTGPRFTGIVGQILFSCGFICMAHNWVFVGYVLIGASMNPVFNSVLSVCNLVPQKRNFVMSLLSSGGDVGKMTFMFLRLAHERFGHLASVRTILLSYVAVSGVQMIVAALLFPSEQFCVSQSPFVEKINNNFDDDPTEDDLLLLHNRDSGFKLTRSVSDFSSIPLATQKRQPQNFHGLTLREQLHTSHYWIFLIFFTLAFFKKLFYNDVLAEVLSMNFDSKGVSHMVTIFSTIQGFAFIWAWLFGYLADIIGVPMVLLIVNSIGIVNCFMSLLTSTSGFVINFLCFSMFKSYTISSAYAFVSNAYGYPHLGTLTGILQVIAGLIVLCNIPFRYWVAVRLDKRFDVGFIILGSLSILATIVPIYYLLKPYAQPPMQMTAASEKRHSSQAYQFSERHTCAGPLFTDVKVCNKCHAVCSCDQYPSARCRQRSTGIFDNDCRLPRKGNQTA